MQLNTASPLGGWKLLHEPSTSNIYYLYCRNNIEFALKSPKWLTCQNLRYLLYEA